MIHRSSRFTRPLAYVLARWMYWLWHQADALQREMIRTAKPGVNVTGSSIYLWLARQKDVLRADIISMGYTFIPGGPLVPTRAILQRITKKYVKQKDESNRK